MKNLFIFLLFISQTVCAQKILSARTIDTIPVIAFVTYCDGCPVTPKKAYLINGQLWYRSIAKFNKGKWFPFRPVWKVWEVRQSEQHKEFQKKQKH